MITVDACCRSLTTFVLVGLAACYTQFDAAPPPAREAARKDSSHAPAPPKPQAPRGQAAQRDKQDKQDRQDKQGRKGKKDKEDKPKEQSYGEAWQLFCQAEKRSGANPAASPKERGEKVSNWFLQHVKNKQLRYWYLALDQNNPTKCRQTFAAEARKAGQAQCPVVDLLYPLSAPKPAAATSSAPP